MKLLPGQILPCALGADKRMLKFQVLNPFLDFGPGAI